MCCFEKTIIESDLSCIQSRSYTNIDNNLNLYNIFNCRHPVPDVVRTGSVLLEKKRMAAQTRRETDMTFHNLGGPTVYNHSNFSPLNTITYTPTSLSLK
jgi:hypothetical protein